MRSRRVLIGVAALLCLVISAILVARSGSRRDARAQEFEGRAGARALCLAVTEFHQSRGVWVVAGPTPATLPGPTGVDFPRVREFEQLGFDPGRVHFQYQVRGEGQARECVARGDPDGDGEVSEFTAQAR